MWVKIIKISLNSKFYILLIIGQSTGSEFILPYAISLVENGEMISIAEDNGEFSGGIVLSDCLKKKEGYNILICVSRSVTGCFVTDMVQSQKHRALKEAASRALNKLFDRLTRHLKTDYENETISNYINQIDISSDTKKPELTKLLKNQGRHIEIK